MAGMKPESNPNPANIASSKHGANRFGLAMQ